VLALFCRARSRLCALPLSGVVETMRPLPVKPVVNAPRFVAGLSLIRGHPVPVVDLGALLAGGEPDSPTRFVSLRVDSRRVALAVEEVCGIRDLPDTLGSLPGLLAHASAELISAVGSLDAELLFLLETARLVPESVWRRLDAETGR
jgi:purine-binding chemotaxis protein CheW